MTQSPRAIFISHTAKESGGELALLYSIPLLNEFAPVMVFLEEGPLVDRFDDAGVTTIVAEVPTASRFSRSASPAVALGRLRPLWGELRALGDQVGGLNPAVVVTNSFRSHLLWRLTPSRTRHPWATIVREPVLEPNFGKANSALVNWALARSDLVIANSPLTQSTVRSKRTVVARPPVQIQAFTAVRERRETDSARLTFGVLGSLSHLKGQDRVIGAVDRAFSDVDHEVRFGGAELFPGADSYSTTLSEVRAAARRPDRVVFDGHIGDVPDWLRGIDVLVVPSRCAEGYSQVAAQALASGVPVVISSEAGAAELVIHGHNGAIFDRESDDSLAEALRTSAMPRVRATALSTFPPGLEQLEASQAARALEAALSKAAGVL